MNILVSTLGATWHIIPETIGFTNFKQLDFYANHPHIPAINETRKECFHAIQTDELWLIATDKHHNERNGRVFNSTEEDYHDICEWNQRCGKIVPRIRLWILQGVEDITNETEASQFRDLAFQIVAYAKQKARDGKLFLSLACGRKTMSADIQEAAYCFGCDALIHIIGEPLHSLDRMPDEADCRKIQPLYLGSYKSNETITDYPIPCFDEKDCIRVEPGLSFLRKIKKLQDDAKYFYTSYYLNQDNDNRDNFQVLYTLPLTKIQELKNTKIGLDPLLRQKELAYLHQLPKTELHCHLGGVLNSEEMIAVAECYRDEIEREKRRNADFLQWCEQIDPMQMPLPKEHWKSWRKETAETIHTKEVLINAAFLIHFAGKPEQLDKILYGDYLNECSFRDIDITRYEELGDLQGSALLKSEPSIRKAVQILLEKAEKDNLLYLELRCSPLNYIGELNAEQVLQCILEELEKGKPNIRKSLLLIASRHGNLNKIDDSIKLMKSMNNKELFVKYFRGFDLAGNESAHSPKELHDKFIDVLKECRNITIHAGETLPAESIWEAVYYLNAERIGHGLTLKNNVSLINKFLERKIGIEMCPSSNYQIKGFKDNYIPESYYEGVYPLKEYLDRELRVCVNTDNPGISRTSFTNELHRAARLTPGGLSLWDIFQLIHNGFLLAFYPYAEKKKMIKEAERIIGRLIKEEKL